MTLPAKPRRVFFSAIVLLCLCSLATYLSFYYFRASERWVSHIQEVRAAIGDLEAEVNGAARARLSYLISGRDGDLKEFRALAARIPGRLQSLRALSSDNPKQRENVAQLEAITRDRLEKWEAAITEKQQGHAIDTDQLLTQNVALANRSAAAASQVRGEESGLLESRTYRARQLYVLASTLVPSSFLLAMLLLVYYYRLAGDELHLREEAERTAREGYALEAGLRQGEQRFRLLIDAVKDYAIFTLDERGRVSSWNDGAARLNGYTAGEIVGKHFSCFYAEQDVQRGKPETELEVATREGRVEDEGWRVRKDGSQFWANVVITAIRNEAGEVIGFVKVTRDFTDRMRAHEALRRANTELVMEVAERKLAESRLATSEKSLRELSRHLLRTQDEERRRIGRDLHDSLGQILAVLKMNLDSLEPGWKPNGESQRISACIRLAEDALREVRTISYLLYPPMLEEMGLKSAIAWYLDGFSKRSNIQTLVDLDPEFGRLPGEVELALFRILQEGLTNVHRHSGSPTAKIRLSMREGKAVLEIQDQGTGIAPNLTDKSAEDWMGSLGVGLRGMNERLRQLGGTLEISSSEKGTIVSAIVPIAKTQGLTRTA